MGKFSYRFSLFTLCGVLLSLPVVARAQSVSELRCRGGEDPLVKLFVIDRLDANTLSLNFNASQKPAGADSSGLEPGTCSWLDRTFKDNESRQVHFQITEPQADSIPAYLKDPKNYWSFFVTSTDKGFFEAKNHQAWSPATNPAVTPGTPSKRETPPASPPSANPPSTPTVSWSGQWNLRSGSGGTPFVLTLEQSGTEVTGTYSPQDGTIDGTLTGRKLTFQWTQAGGYKGTGVLEMAIDGQLDGVFTIVEGPKQGETRAFAERAGGMELPPAVEEQPKTPPASFAGKWDLRVVLGGASFALNLEQAGSKVAGTYAPQDGTIEGTVTAQVLRFQWTQAGGYQGVGFLEMNSAGDLVGSLTIVEGPKKGGNRVGAKRASQATRQMPGNGPI
jgi:hypothetical protein